MKVYKCFYSYDIGNHDNTGIIDTRNEEMNLLAFSHKDAEKTFTKLKGKKPNFIREIISVNHVSPEVVKYINVNSLPEYAKDLKEHRDRTAEERIQENDGDVRMRNMSEVKSEKQDVGGVL